MKKIIIKISRMNDYPDDIVSILMDGEINFWNLLIRRAKLQHKFIKESAATIGTEAHKVFDELIKSRNNISLENWHKSILSMINPYIDSFYYWLQTEKLRIVCGDTKLASLKYGYGGSMDVGLEDSDGKLVIGDFKTGKSIHDDHAYQVGGAYAQAAMETFGLNYVPKAVIIRFEKNKKKYERREVRDSQHAFRGFKAAFELKKASEEIHFINQEIVKEKNRN